MRVRVLAGAAVGLATGSFATSKISELRRASLVSTPLCGTYVLTSVWERSDEAASSSLQTRKRSGILVYNDDGRMWTQCHAIDADGKQSEYTGYAARWWVHDGVGTLCPPHGGQQLVEHQIKAASDPAMNGMSVWSQYQLSEGGHKLTTTDVKILLGKATVLEQLEWRRVMSQDNA